MDATATPMFDCFIPPGAGPDFTPFDAATNNVPLDEMNPLPKLISDPLLRKDAQVRRACRSTRRTSARRICSTTSSGVRRKVRKALIPDWAVKAVEDND